ncbi:MAG TPA: glycosyltransferase family 9 protein [Ktedonobacteraceae bacterium]|nr:glycosyltransferase family 9 protein [Ktedonobacteraceae bacterium]
MIDERWRSARRILAIRLDNLGDVLVTTPALHAIKTSMPTIALSLLTSPVGAQVASLNPDIDEVIVYEAPWMDPWQRLPQSSKREQQMIAMIKERQFDGAIIFTSYHQSSLPAAYLCYLADIPLRLAASIDGPGSLLTTRHKHPERMMHEVERGLDLVNAIGLSTKALDLVLKVPSMARESIYEFLSAQNVDPFRPLLVIHPGCSMPARTYPYEMYAQVLDLVIERLGATVVVTGTQDEQTLVERLLDRVQEHNRRAILACAGTLPFPDFCALIEAADLMITNNTGPMHIAAAVKTPVVALFALTNPPEQWGPWHIPHRQLYHDVFCRICYNRICPYNHECLRLVTPEQVADASEELLLETIPGLIDISGKYRIAKSLPYELRNKRLSTLLRTTSASAQTGNQVNDKKVLR